MRIHCLENVDKSLTFLNEQRVHLENMGAHDIVDGNPRLTLGLIWTIILRFQVCARSNWYAFERTKLRSNDVSSQGNIQGVFAACARSTTDFINIIFFYFTMNLNKMRTKSFATFT